MKLITLLFPIILFSCNKSSNLTSMVSGDAKVKFKIDLISYGSERDTFDFACFDQKKLEDYQEKANLAFLNSKKLEEKAPDPTFIFSQKYTRNKTIEFEAKLPKVANTCKIVFAVKLFGTTTHLPKDLSFSNDKKFAYAFVPLENGHIEFKYNGFNGNIYPSLKYENIELVFNEKK